MEPGDGRAALKIWRDAFVEQKKAALETSAALA